VGEVPTFRASDTNADLPIVLADLFMDFNTLRVASSFQNEDLEAIQSLHRIKR
jgi:hypothetical protein